MGRTAPGVTVGRCGYPLLAGVCTSAGSGLHPPIVASVPSTTRRAASPDLARDNISAQYRHMVMLQLRYDGVTTPFHGLHRH
jgi:hypothetical protein